MKSLKRTARIAGVLYLLVAIFAAFAFSVITKLYVAGDAATTAGNLVANADLVRLAVVADLAQATIWVFLALTLSNLLRPVDESAARAMVVLVAIGAGIVCLNIVFAFVAMLVATSGAYAEGLGAGGANAAALLLLEIQHYGVSATSVFYGLWLAPLGYLVYRSERFPKALGVALIVVCFCYLAKLLAAFLAPDLGAAIDGYLGIPIWVFELWMVLYLLLFGVRTARPNVPIPATA